MKWQTGAPAATGVVVRRLHHSTPVVIPPAASPHATRSYLAAQEVPPTPPPPSPPPPHTSKQRASQMGRGRREERGSALKLTLEATRQRWILREAATDSRMFFLHCPTWCTKSCPQLDRPCRCCVLRAGVGSRAPCQRAIFVILSTHRTVCRVLGGGRGVGGSGGGGGAAAAYVPACVAGSC